ncbi:MAG: 50S ribosomal protein L25/general stress protein Ctc [Candidatus Omnitrophica bacterium]|nr:50S ribosomal protein L25/general stress protein Ctc [Candidatus Omnitrophota bacterium]MBU3933710.1 50S ribosomal protein L25/general stress protein Ctc [Candidatus Omnitrophota bacterium]MBU4140425.1 50S ribosomal protein L25/general stress protein Ctc [Candidatus Omnitrophota bacterium]
MEKINLKAKLREELGKEAVKKLRAQGLIPAVVYKGRNSLNIKVPSKDFLEVIHTKAGENVVVNLQIESKKLPRTAIIKETQYHPVRGNVLHVDFNEISLTEVLTVKVPIAVKGEAQGIKEGGVLEHALWEIEVECLPTQIPENIPVDVSPLKIGDSILVKDLQLPGGVKVLSDPETTVVSLAVPRAEEEEVAKPEEEAVEPEVIMEKKPEEEEEAPGEGAK